MDEIFGGKEEDLTQQSFELQINSVKYYSKGEALLHSPIEITNKLKDILLENDKVYFIGQVEKSKLRKMLQIILFLFEFSFLLSFVLCVILAMSTHNKEFWYESFFFLFVMICYGGVLYNMRRFFHPIDNFVCITEQQFYFLSVEFDGETSISLSPLLSLSFTLLLKVDNNNNNNLLNNSFLNNNQNNNNNNNNDNVYLPITDPLSSSISSTTKNLIYNLDNDLYLQIKKEGNISDLIFIPSNQREETIGRLQSLFNTYRHQISLKNYRLKIIALILIVIISLVLLSISLWAFITFNYSFLPLTPIFMSISIYFFILFALSVPDLLRKRLFVIYF